MLSVWMSCFKYESSTIFFFHTSAWFRPNSSHPIKQRKKFDDLRQVSAHHVIFCLFSFLIGQTISENIYEWFVVNFVTDILLAPLKKYVNSHFWNHDVLIELWKKQTICSLGNPVILEESSTFWVYRIFWLFFIFWNFLVNRSLKNFNFFHGIFCMMETPGSFSFLLIFKMCIE
jgi:hypothetical protein